MEAFHVDGRVQAALRSPTSRSTVDDTVRNTELESRPSIRQDQLSLAQRSFKVAGFPSTTDDLSVIQRFRLPDSSPPPSDLYLFVPYLNVNLPLIAAPPLPRLSHTSRHKSAKEGNGTML